MFEKIRTMKPRLIVQLLVVSVIAPLLPLILTGRWDWLEAWIYAIISILGFVLSRLLLTWRSPKLMAERGRNFEHDDTKSWDKMLAPIVATGGALVPLVAGLDARFGWSGAFSSTVHVIGAVLIVLGYVIGTYARLENQFFSPVVRIQTDRSHSVVSTGPYAWVRHPGYSGILLRYLAAPLLLDAAWAWVPAILLTAAFVIRTRLEDNTLQVELPGYAAYAQKTRYRLLPGIW